MSVYGVLFWRQGIVSLRGPVVRDCCRSVEHFAQVGDIRTEILCVGNRDTFRNRGSFALRGTCSRGISPYACIEVTQNINHGN